MALLDELLPGSYKGVSFLIKSSRVGGGRKDIKHSFPNSNKQAIEDLGLSPRVYTVDAVVTGDNYILDRDLLIGALEEGGTGVLIHPLYGQLDNIVSRTYTLAENLTELGEAQFNITFEISNDIGIPDKVDNTFSLLEFQNENVSNAVNSDLADNFEVTPTLLNTFSNAVDKMESFVDTIQEKTNLIQASADQINAFNYQLGELSGSITALVQAPQALADSITDLFITIDNLYPSAEAAYDVLIGLFDFGDDDTPKAETTAARIQTNKNSNLINSTMQMLALSYAYFNAAQITFQSLDDINEKFEQLEAQFQKVIAADGFSEDTKDTIKDLRVQYEGFMDSQKLTTQKIINVYTPLTSARLLSFQYYGDSSNGEDLAELNGVDDISFMEGSVQVLSS